MVKIWIRRLIPFTVIFIFLSLVIRTVLMFNSIQWISISIPVILKIFLTGLFYDIITFFYLAIPLVIFYSVIPNRLLRHKFFSIIIQIVYFLFIAVIVFDGIAEYLFFEEFGVRFNFIAVDYLVYTTEVIGNIAESYPMPLIFFLIAAISSILFVLTRYLLPKIETKKISIKLTAAGLIICLLFPLAGYIFVDNDIADISDNEYENNLAINGIYSLFASFIDNKLNYYHFYATLNEKDIFKYVDEQLLLPNINKQKNGEYSIHRKITRSGQENKYNVILITVESLSAKFFSAFGNKKNLTPYLDRLSGESLFFTNLYATGNRTVRGLEAITLSIPPTPGRSMIKRPLNENLISSAGWIFKKRGYDNKFIYGGHGYFDNMNYFFSHNGFKIIDRTDFSDNEETFATIWGLCDEDLFARVLKESDKSYNNNHPFFSIVMTTSNHRPYKYPDLRIDILSGTGRDGAVKYCDYSIGKFIENAASHKWFSNTIFIIIADHCASSAGKTELSVDKYHIPMLIYAPDIIKPREINKLCSQIDVIPTVLDILNWSYDSYFFGESVLRMTPEHERAFIANYQKLGLLTNNRLIILGPKKKKNVYTVDFSNYALTKIDKPGSENIVPAISYYQAAAYLNEHPLRYIQ